MGKALLIAFFYTLAIYCLGQNDIGIKIYQNTDIFETSYNEYETGEVTKVKNINFTRVTVAVNLSKRNGTSHEIELFIPEISKSLNHVLYPQNYGFNKSSMYDGTVSTYSLRYTVSKTLTPNSKPLAFQVGTGINPYYIFIEYEPNVETTFYSSTKLYGFVLNLTPELKYKFNKRFSTDVSVPLKIYDLRRNKTTIKNPHIPVHQQTFNNTRNIFFENAYTIRIGLKYKLSK